MSRLFSLVDRTQTLPALLNTDFRPPRRNMKVVNCINRLMPSLLRFGFGIENVDIDPDSITRLRRLENKRLLITPNHPTADDPLMLYSLASRSNMPCYYLACREIFDDVWGLKGRLLQNVGAYSVVRGTVDRESFRTTRELLAQPAGRVVIFPEGEIYSQNDTLLPFHSGVIQMAFWAMDDLRKQGEEDNGVIILPVAIRYRFTQNMDRIIEMSLDDLEKALNIKPASMEGSDFTSHCYMRLRTIGRVTLETLEKEYGLKSPKDSDSGSDFTERIVNLKHLLLDRAANLIGITFPQEAEIPDRLRMLVNEVYEVTREEPHSDEWPPYRKRLHSQQAARIEPLLLDLNRVANWIAYTDNYVKQRPSVERIADTIRRLEIEAFGEYRITGRRSASIHIGEPIDLKDYYARYREDRKGTVNKCVDVLETAVQGLLDASLENTRQR